jgi:hypothetical protein
MESSTKEFEFKLTRHEISGSTWLKTQQLFTSMLQREREKNDSNALTEEKTAAIRGKIALLKELLGLDAELRESFKKKDEDDEVPGGSPAVSAELE